MEVIMAGVDLTRIAGNIQALNSLNSLNNINNRLATHQLRLATGKRINEASDDPAGMSIATTFDIRRQSLSTVLKSIGDGKSLLSTAEGGLTKIQDILVKMKNKVLEAQGDTIGDNEKAAIQKQVASFMSEIDDIVQATEWNGTYLLSSGSYNSVTTSSASASGYISAGSAGNAAEPLNFLTDADGDVTEFDIGQGFSVTGTSTSGLDLSGINIIEEGNDDAISDAMDDINDAIDKVKGGVADVGSFTARLTFKEEALTIAQTNTEAAYNRIMNADMAREQVEASKLMILQQTAVAMLAQANMAPQFVLSLFQ
jgi:flagellin